MPVVVRVLVVLGAVLAALGLVAGHFNRELLDGPTSPTTSTGSRR